MPRTDFTRTFEALAEYDRKAPERQAAMDRLDIVASSDCTNDELVAVLDHVDAVYAQHSRPVAEAFFEDTKAFNGHHRDLILQMSGERIRHIVDRFRPSRRSGPPACQDNLNT